MTISFSGLASGLDTSSWVESLVALKKAKVTALEEEKTNIQSLQETLSSIKSFFSSFRSMLEKVTDAKFGVTSMDLFAQNLATSSNLDVLTGSATSEAQEATYNVLVDKLASETKANSNYSYMTTIIQTTTATNDSKLINLGVKAGNIGVMVNGVERGVSITENDTIATFIEKLKNIGVDASYNEDTGVFSINVGDNDIRDIDGTGIVDALHLQGVNKGYQSNDLKTSSTDTIYSAATEATLLSDLGVKAGVITVKANGTNYNITIYEDSTMGTFMSDLNACHIDNKLDVTGVFTISDAEITNEGKTGILDALGFDINTFSKSQATKDLTHSTVVTQVTTATSDTLLKDLGSGTAIADGQTVIVKNSSNEYATLTVGTTTTLGQLIEGLSNAGLYAALNSDGTVEITGGTIEGGTFDAVNALGLEREPYNAMVTGKSLTETVTVHNIVDLQTKLVDDLKVSEGYLEVTDANGDKYYEKIYSGQTIADFMTDMGNLGINTSLDETTGILTITGGAFKTLSDADVAALVANKTIVEPDSRYVKGTDLLTCLYGADTISTDQITVASTYSKTKALRHTVTNTIDASLTTTLMNLGFAGNGGDTVDGSAIFKVRDEYRTIDLDGTNTIQDLINILNTNGIAASWDDDTHKLTIENATVTGGTSNLKDVLNLTEKISGKYTTSNNLYTRETLAIDATRDSLLSNYGIKDSMSDADRTVTLYNNDGTVAKTTVVSEGTTIGNLLDWINEADGISATLKDGFLTINNGYIENATLKNSMGLETSNKSSYVLGSVMSVTTTAAVTGETTLGHIISDLGTTDAVKDGYTLSFNGKTIDVSASTTVNDLIDKIYAAGGTASLDHTGRLSINGGTLTGTVANALGMKSVTNTSSVEATGNTLYRKEEVYADRDTTFANLGISDGSYVIYNSLAQATTTVEVSSTSTIGEFLDGLKNNGIDGVIANGVIKLTSAEGNYITGTIPTALGINSLTTTEVVNTTQSSTIGITYTDRVKISESTLINTVWDEIMSDMPAASAYPFTVQIMDKNGFNLGRISYDLNTKDVTFGEFFEALKEYGIEGSITDGVIHFQSEVGNWISTEKTDLDTLYTAMFWERIGVTGERGSDLTTTIAKTSTSTLSVTYTETLKATEDTLLSDLSSDLTFNVYNSSNSTIATITMAAGSTIGNLITTLGDYNINATINDGVISMVSHDGNYVKDGLFDKLGVGTTTVVVTTTSGATSTSTAGVTYTSTKVATKDTTLGELGIKDDNLVLKATNSDGTYTQTFTTASTLSDVFNWAASYGIQGDINNGVISFTGDNRNGYVSGTLATALGIGTTSTTVTVTTTATGTDLISTIGLTYTTTVAVDENTKIIDIEGITDPGENGWVIDCNFLIQGIRPVTKQTTLGTDATVGDLLSVLNNFDASASLENGIIKIDNGSTGTYFKSDLLEELGLSAMERTLGVASTSTAKVNCYITTTANATSTLVSVKYNKIDGSISASGVTGTVIGISTAQDLVNLQNLVNRGYTMQGKTFVLMDDIDLSGSDFTGIGVVGNGGYSFSGTFDGAGHTISNMSITIDGTDSKLTGNLGLFYGLASGAVVKNLNIDSFTFNQTARTYKNYYNVGILAAVGQDATISGVTVTNSTINLMRNDNWNFGGILGAAASVTISNCATSFTGSGGIATGGIVGVGNGFNNNDATTSLIEKCRSTADLHNNYISGGIVGLFNSRSYRSNKTLNIQNCQFSGNIDAESGYGAGIAGYMQVVDGQNCTLNISNCVVDGSIVQTNDYRHSVYFNATADHATSGYSNNKLNISNCYHSQLVEMDLNSKLYRSDSSVVSVTASGLEQLESDKNLSGFTKANGWWEPATLMGSARSLTLVTTNEYTLNAYANGDASPTQLKFNGSTTLAEAVAAASNYITTELVNGQIVENDSTSVGLYKFSGGFYDNFMNKTLYIVPFNGDITGNNTLSDVAITQNGTITVNQSGKIRTVTVDAYATFDTMFAQLAAYGIEGSIDSSGRIVLKGNNDSYITDISSDLASKLKLRSGLNYTYRTGSYNSDSRELNTTVQKTIDTNTKLTDIGASVGDNFYIGYDEGSYEVTVTKDMTIGDFFTCLAAYGIEGSIIDDGKIQLKFSEGRICKGMDTDLGNALQFDPKDIDNITISEVTTKKYHNTNSDQQSTSVTQNLTTATKFSDLNVGADGLITVRADGTNHVITVKPADTIDDLISTLAGYGIAGSVSSDGKITLVGSNDAYIISMADNIKTALNLNVGSDHTYTSATHNEVGNTNSSSLSHAYTRTMRTDSTFADIGLTANGTIEIKGNDLVHSLITVRSDQTIDDILTTLAGYGISGTVSSDGKLSLTGRNGYYISEMSDNLKAALKMDVGKNHTWTTEVGQTWINTDSNSLEEDKTGLKLTSDTVLSKIEGFDNGNGSLIVHKTDGTYVTISVDSSKTIDEFFNQISEYGLIGSIDSDGKATITGVGNVYLQAVDGGSNILSALKLSNLKENVQTVTVNQTSSTLRHTVSVAATGTTTLENLMKADGTSITFTGDKVDLVIDAYSDAGNKNVTLQFSKTSSIYDVIGKLSEYGIRASLDTTGRFSISSSSLNDFDLSGELGSFLMGTYTKNYGTDTTYNVSTNLVQKTIVNMTDSSRLTDFGITNGDIEITQQGVKYTINIDTTNILTVGDFKDLLSQYGFSSTIDDRGRLSITGVGDSYLSSVTGGSNILEIFGLTNWTQNQITQNSNYLSDSTESVHKITMDTKISQLLDASGNNLNIKGGQIYVYQDGTRSTLNINTDDSLQTLAAKLSQYGISIEISQNGSLYFEGNNDSYLTTTGITTANASDILTKIGIGGDWSTRYDSISDNLKYEKKSRDVVTGSTKLKDLQDTTGKNLGITDGAFYVYSSGVRNTETVTSDMTVNDLMATLAKYGLVADIDENGTMSVGAYNNTYLATSALAGDNSNIVNNLFEKWNFVNIYKSNGLDIPTDEVRAVTRDTKLSSINEGTYSDGYITVVKDGVQTNISLTADDTFGTLMDELALHGFESVINDKGQLIIKNTGDSLLQNYTGSEKKSNILDIIGIKADDWVKTDTYKSSTLDVVKTTTSNVSATRDTRLSELVVGQDADGKDKYVSTGEFYIYNNGVKYTAMVSTDETIGSLMDTLKSFGIETSLVDGPNGAVLSIIGKGDSYVSASNGKNASNVVDLFVNGIQETKEYKGLEQTSKVETIYSAATEETLVNYFDNGVLTAEGDLSITVNGVENIIKISADETFGSLLQKFKNLGLEATMSNGKIFIQSGFNTFKINDTSATTSNLAATIGLTYNDKFGGYAASQLTIQSTTTNIEEKTLSVSNYASDSTKLSMLNIKEGTLTIYRNGEKATINIEANDDFSALKNRISTKFSDVLLGFDNGYLTITSNAGNTVEVGATTDTSNFSAITGITSDGNGGTKSARELYCVNTDSVITQDGIFRKGKVIEGTFIVGDATFTIGATTTMSDIISQINSNDKANATAYWDNVDGKFVIKSRTTGAALVNIEAGTSNFTDILGFTNSTWTSDGKVDSTKMNMKSQAVGNNARLSINGTTYTSTSNTITSDVSKIKGLTINLKGLSEGSTVTLKVERDKETLANAVSDIVDSYNELMKKVDESIAKDGKLKNESTLKLIRNQLRSLMTSTDAGTTIFRNLDSIGVGTSAASGTNISTSNDSIINMTFDKDKFLKAYEADQDAVKALLIGSNSNKGVFSKVETLVESTLQSVSGYFATTESSYNKQITNLNSKITRANKEVERYKARLEAKFSAMDLLIAQMQQQYSSFLTT